MRLDPRALKRDYISRLTERYAGALVDSILHAVRVLSFVRDEDKTLDFFQSLNANTNLHPVSLIHAIEKGINALIKQAGYKPAEISFDDIFIEPIYMHHASAFLENLVRRGDELLGSVEIKRGVSGQILKEYEKALSDLVDEFSDLKSQYWKYANYKKLSSTDQLLPWQVARLRQLQDELTRTGLLDRFTDLEQRYSALLEQFGAVEELLGDSVWTDNLLKAIRRRINKAHELYNSMRSMVLETYRSAYQSLKSELRSGIYSSSNAYDKEDIKYLEQIGLIKSERSPRLDPVQAEIRMIHEQTEQTVEAAAFGKRIGLGGGGTALVTEKANAILKSQDIRSLYSELSPRELERRRSRWFEAMDLGQSVMIKGSAVPYQVVSIDEELGTVTLAAQKLPRETRVMVEVEPGAFEAIRESRWRAAAAEFLKKDTQFAYGSARWVEVVSEVVNSQVGSYNAVATMDIINAIAASWSKKDIKELTSAEMNKALMDFALSVAPWAKGKYEDVDIISASWLAFSDAVNRASVAGKIDIYNPLAVLRDKTFRKRYRSVLLKELFASDLRASYDEYDAIASIGSKLRDLTVRTPTGDLRRLTDLEKARLIQRTVRELLKEAEEHGGNTGIEHLAHIADMDVAEIARHLRRIPIEEETFIVPIQEAPVGSISGADVSTAAGAEGDIAGEIEDNVFDEIAYELDLSEIEARADAAGRRGAADIEALKQMERRITDTITSEIDLSGMSEREAQDLLDTLLSLSEESGGKVRFTTYVKQSDRWYPVVVGRGTGGELFVENVITGQRFLVKGAEELTAGLFDEFGIFEPRRAVQDRLPAGYQRLTRAAGVVYSSTTPPSAGVTIDESLGTLNRLRVNTKRRPYTVAAVSTIRDQNNAVAGLGIQMARYSRDQQGRIISELIGEPQIISITPTSPDDIISNAINELRRIRQDVDYITGYDIGEVYDAIAGVVQQTSPEVAPKLQRELTALFGKPKMDIYTLERVFDLPSEGDVLGALEVYLSAEPPGGVDIRPLRKGDILYRYRSGEWVMGNAAQKAGDSMTRGIYRFGGIEERDGIFYAMVERLEPDEAGRFLRTGIVDRIAAESFSDLVDQFHSQFTYVRSADDAARIYSDLIQDYARREISDAKRSMSKLAELVAYSRHGGPSSEAFQSIADRAQDIVRKIGAGDTSLTPGEQLLISMLGGGGKRDISAKTIDKIRHYLTKDHSRLYELAWPYMQEWLESPEGQAFRSIAEDIIRLGSAGVLHGRPEEIYKQAGDIFKDFLSRSGIEVPRYEVSSLYRFSGILVGGQTAPDLNINAAVPEDIYNRLRNYVSRHAGEALTRREVEDSLIQYFRQLGVASDNVQDLGSLAQAIYSAAQTGQLEGFRASVEAAHIPAITDEETASRFVDFVYSNAVLPGSVRMSNVHSREQLMEALGRRPIVSERLASIESGIQELREAGIDVVELPALGRAAGEMVVDVATESIPIPPWPVSYIPESQDLMHKFTTARQYFDNIGRRATYSSIEGLGLRDQLERLHARLKDELLQSNRPTWQMLGTGGDMLIPLVDNIPGVGDIFFRRISDFTPEQLETIVWEYARVGDDTIPGRVRANILQYLSELNRWPDVEATIERGIDPLTGMRIPLVGEAFASAASQAEAAVGAAEAVENIAQRAATAAATAREAVQQAAKDIVQQTDIAETVARQIADEVSEHAAQGIARAADAISSAPGAEGIRAINEAIKAKAAGGAKEAPGAGHIRRINQFIKAKAAAKSASGTSRGVGNQAADAVGDLLGSAIGNWKVLVGIGLATMGLIGLLAARDKDDYLQPETSGGRYTAAHKPIPIAPPGSESEQSAGGEVYQRPVPVENVGARITIRGKTKRRLSAEDFSAIANEVFGSNVNINVNFSNDTSALNEDYAREVFSQLLKYGYVKI